MSYYNSSFQITTQVFITISRALMNPKYSISYTFSVSILTEIYQYSCNKTTHPRNYLGLDYT